MDQKLDVNHPSELPSPEEKLLRKPTFMEKFGWGRIIFIILLLIAALGFLFYAMTARKAEQAQVPTSTTRHPDWLTYTDRVGRFTLQYPKSYTIGKTSLTSVQVLSPTIPAINTNFRLGIQYKNVVLNQTMEQLITLNKPCSTIAPQGGTPSTINGKTDAQVYVDTPCGELTSTVVYTINDDMLYIITVDSQAKFSEIKKYVDPIIATLKFN